ncbi:MAG: TetR family transcriptional regulator [Actinomycetota bacterium]|nr:TetR family transcriptional regulator [Actinomycetota bacterium]
MEKSSRTRLLDAALELLGRSGAASLTVRAAEDAAGLPHGSVRHHFGDRQAMVVAIFDHLAERESAPVGGGVAEALEDLLGPGRTMTLARYELFLMAARDSTLQAPLVRARDRFVAAAAERVGARAAPTVVAALDGLVLDALVRGRHDPAQLRAAVAQITGAA